MVAEEGRGREGKMDPWEGAAPPVVDAAQDKLAARPPQTGKTKGNVKEKKREKGEKKKGRR